MAAGAAITVEGLRVERGGRVVLHEVTPPLGAAMAADVHAIGAFTLAALGLGALTVQRRTA